VCSKFKLFAPKIFLNFFFGGENGPRCCIFGRKRSDKKISDKVKFWEGATVVPPSIPATKLLKLTMSDV